MLGFVIAYLEADRIRRGQTDCTGEHVETPKMILWLYHSDRLPDRYIRYTLAYSDILLWETWREDIPDQEIGSAGKNEQI